MRQGSDADRYERKKSQYSRVEVESFMILKLWEEEKRSDVGNKVRKSGDESPM